MSALPSSATAVPAAAPLPRVPADPAAAILAAARLLLPRLERGERVDIAILRNAMEAAFGTSDASGACDWKLAYEAGEAASVLPLRKYGRALFRTAPSPAARLSLLAKIAGLLPAQTRRSEECQVLQQFSTPSPSVYARANDPFARVGKVQVSVEVSSVIRASPNSFRIAWTERRYQDGALAATERWSAILTVAVQTPRDADTLRKNPLGLYVTAIDWSKELGQ